MQIEVFNLFIAVIRPIFLFGFWEWKFLRKRLVPVFLKIMEDFYETLGLGRNASRKAIFKAYQHLALQYHPERNTKDTEEEFVQVNKAYQVLGDQAVKKWYDKLYDQYFLEKAIDLDDSEEAKGQAKINEAIQKGIEKGKAYSPYGIFSRKVFRQAIWESIYGFIVMLISGIAVGGSIGFLMIFAGIYCLVNFRDQTNMIGGSISIIAGILFIWWKLRILGQYQSEKERKGWELGF